MCKGMFFVLSGTAGAGKDSVMSRLRVLEPRVHYCVTATTRPPRAGERDGEDYYFMAEDALRDLLARGELLEHAEVYGRLYGVPLGPIRDALARGDDVFARVDVQGVRSIRLRVPAAISIFLYVPEADDLVERLQLRDTESPDELDRRMAAALDELSQRAEFDYAVPNPRGRLDEAVDDVRSIMHAERRRTHPRFAELDPDERS